MYDNFIARDIDDVLPLLMASVLNGPERDSRNGRMRELTHVGITLTHPCEREIRLPSRKHNLAAQIAETMWVLAGRDDVEWLSRYLPRAVDYSDDGSTWRGAYGKRLRSWGGAPQPYVVTMGAGGSSYYAGGGGGGGGGGSFLPPRIDQLANVVSILRQDPDSRRAVLQIYDPRIDSHGGKDIPCNDWITLLLRDGKLDMHVAVRSNDLMWGWSGINAFEWSVLLEILAGVLLVEVGSLHFSITSLHLYKAHWDRAEKICGDDVPPVNPDRVKFVHSGDRSMEYVYDLIGQWFHIEEHIRSGTGGVDQAIREFPEPMLRSWLEVIRWWWQGEPLERIRGTRLQESAAVAVLPKSKAPSPFAQYVTELHKEKDAAYGDSWCKRGEMLGIMANIARKIDRLGSNRTKDESSADTAIDLLVYLAKYRWWLVNEAAALAPGGVYNTSDKPVDLANQLITRLSSQTRRGSAQDKLEEGLTRLFDRLEVYVKADDVLRYELVDEMLQRAVVLAEILWTREGNTTRSFTGYDTP